MLASIISLPVLLVEQARTEQPQHQKELAVKFANVAGGLAILKHGYPDTACKPVGISNKPSLA
jgi:hypothetical protein